MHQLKRRLASLLIVSLFFAMIPLSTMNADNLLTQDDEDSQRATKRGLQFRLSEGAEQPTPRDPEPARATNLSDSETQRILGRLRPIKADPDDEKEFAFRERSLPPPRTGRTISQTFPAVEQPGRPDETTPGPLQVLRYSPEGEVPIAPSLSVTFSQPMVAVTSNQDLAAQDVPVNLSPQPPGRWRWIGTRTLLFEPEDRFPMATNYSVNIPAGVRSATGVSLGSAKAWTFATPPPQIKSSFPTSGPQRRDQTIFIEFDQKIDPNAVLRTIKVHAGKSEVPIRLATQQEIESDSTVKKLAAVAQPGRWLAFRALDSSGNPANALPANTPITVTVGPGTPSAEGPRTTTKAQTVSFSTYGPLKVTKSQCGYQQPCSPYDQWTIQFSNPLDASAFDQSQLRIEPAVSNIKASIYGNTLYIYATKKGRVTYKLTLDKSIRDAFGQTLGQDVTVTFNVGAAPPALTASASGLVVLEPAGPPRYSVYTINHQELRVSLYKVGPEDWPAFASYMRYASGYTGEAKQSPPGTAVSARVVQVKAQPDELVETAIDLKPALDGTHGQILVVVETTTPQRRGRDRIVAWVQVTDIGLDAFVDNTELVAWTTALKDGSPLGNMQLTIQPSGVMGTSGADGVARLELKPKTTKGINILVARRGSDLAILPEHTYWWNQEGGWQRTVPANSLRWYVFDDRKMYRPGEEVHVKGWIRKIGESEDGDVMPLGDAATSVNYVLRDARGNELKKGMLGINAFGGFDTAFKLPDAMNLGYAQLELEAHGGSESTTNRKFVHNFQVQEFRRPEFEVTTQVSEGPHFVRGHADAAVTASYFAGGGLQNAEVRWQVTSLPGHYTPPNRGDFIFGKWIPWWRPAGSDSEINTETFTGQTDAMGRHRLRIDFDSVDPPRPSNVTAEASVTDVNRQTWTSRANILVHPADLYVGMRSPRTFVQKGEPLIIESIVTDLDGKAMTGREIRMRAVMLDWVFEKGEWKQKEINPQECTVASANDPVKCVFQSKEGGTYRVTATIRDNRERLNESELTLWVAGGKLPPRRNVEQEDAELIPDKKEYKPGETAEILVQAPFYPAEGLMTLRRSGIVRTERFKMDSPSYTLKVPIAESYIPNIHVQVDLVGAATRTDQEGNPLEKLPKRPAFAKGNLNLSIPPLSRELSVTATPRDTALEPGAETDVSVAVKDAQGNPVKGAEVALVVVDESVLSLTNYKLADPIEVFYAQRGEGASNYYSRARVMLSDSEQLEALGRIAEGAKVNGSDTVSFAMMRADAAARMGVVSETVSVTAAEEPPIDLRKDFDALAIFAPSLPTDANGQAHVKVKMPDNLTRYRVMAVSVSGGKFFGLGESSITARLPLMVRPSAPRFLNFGDRFELPVVVQNQTNTPMRVDVAVRASNAELTEGQGRSVTVPANDRVEIRFPAAAAKPGTARFQIAAASGKWSDAAEIELPVWTPATTEAFATYGEIDQGAIVQPVKAPSDAIRQFGGLEVTTSSTQLQALTDAVIYLVSYPFECSEQLASRILGIAALKDVLSAFDAKGLPPPDEMKAAVARDIKRLQNMRNDDGSFPLWRRGDKSWPYVSIHAAHALQRAKEKDFEVPKEMLDKSRQYLRNIEARIPSDYPIDCRRALIAYALYVRNRMGDRDVARARKLIQEAGLDKLSLEAVGWLLTVLSGDPNSKSEVAAIRTLLNNRATESAGTAHFVTSYTDGEYLMLHSDHRADGIILEALIGDQPNSDLIPKIVRGLLAHRKAGRWLNTQENVFILLALDRYFATYERQTPNFVARMWLGDRYAGEQQFKGRTTDSYNLNIPMRYVAETEKPQNLSLSKEGTGRLYYRIGMQYAPTSLKLNPADYGFTVQRVYEPVDDPNDVRRDSDGTWRLKAGARVRVKLTMVATSRRYHVALVDPLPAGLEALNPALAVTETIPRDRSNEDRSGYWWWWRQWYEHQNLRDERVEAFTSLLWEGVYTYSYVARATTPGAFVVPPAKAEEMYHPENFGRSSTDRVVIE